MICTDKHFTLRALQALSLAENYKSHIYFNEIRPYLGKRVMEVGAGIGVFAKYLIKEPLEFIILSDIEPLFIKIMKKTFTQKNVVVKELDISSKELDKSIISKRIDTIIANHVIEHTDDNISFRNISEILTDGGHLIMRVPAFNLFYNKIDKKFGHIKRYTKGELCKKLKSHGFEVKICEYRDSLKLPLWVIFGFSDITSDILFFPKVIKILDYLYGKMKTVINAINWLGADIYCVATKC